MNASVSKMTIRPAVQTDLAAVLAFIRELAEYEKMAGQVVATEELLREWMFEKGAAEALIGEVDGEAVGFALFFHNFSTFQGLSLIHI